MSFNILVLTSDRSAGFNFCKSLQYSKKQGDDLNIIGTSTHPARAQLTANDITVLIPKEIEKDPVLIKEHAEGKLGLSIDLLYETRSGTPMVTLSRQRENLPVFLPHKESVEIFEDKYKTFKHLEEQGLPVPQTRLLQTPEDVHRAMKEVSGNEFWIRAIQGYAGAGSFSSGNADEIISVIEQEMGWGYFTLSEKLPLDSHLKWEERLSDTIHAGEMVNWSALYHEGKLIAAQTRKRLYFEHQDLTKGGVSHTGGIMTLQNEAICALSDKIIRSFGWKPHGALGIDFLADQKGDLKVTEIQPCRFFATTYFMSALGLNFPRLFVDSYRGNSPALDKRLDPLSAGMVWMQRFGSDDTYKHRDVLLDLLKKGFLKFSAVKACFTGEIMSGDDFSTRA